VIERRGLTSYAVAIAAGVDPPGLLRWTKREKTLSLDTLDKVATALGLTLTEGRGGLR
jgi:transcriptional regulator with XRE-family HTH domain